MIKNDTYATTLPVYHKGHLTDEEAHYALTNRKTLAMMENYDVPVRFLDYHWGLDEGQPRGWISGIKFTREGIYAHVEIPNSYEEMFKEIKDPVIRMDTYGYGKSIKILHFTLMEGKKGRFYDRVIDPYSEDTSGIIYVNPPDRKDMDTTNELQENEP